MSTTISIKFRIFFLLSFLAVLFFSPEHAFAKTAKEIDAQADAAFERFQKEVYGAPDIIKRAKAVLIFPKVYRGGIGLGAEYGQGALRIDGQTVDYYSTVGGSLGFQLGGQVKTMFLFFMEESALKNFRASSGWKAGIDGSVALISVGADGSIDTMKTNEPIVAIVIGQKGLMYNLTLEGAKFTKLRK